MEEQTLLGEFKKLIDEMCKILKLEEKIIIPLNNYLRK